MTSGEDSTEDPIDAIGPVSPVGPVEDPTHAPVEDPADEPVDYPADTAEMQAAIVQYETTRRLPTGPTDMIVAVAATTLHVGLFILTVAMTVQLLPDYSGCYIPPCGDQAMADSGVLFAAVAGLVVLLADLVIVTIRLAQHRLASVAPVVGCILQVVIAVCAYLIIRQSAPM